MDYTILLKKPVTIYVGGSPDRGLVPPLTISKVKNPQLVIDSEKGTIIIMEST